MRHTDPDPAAKRIERGFTLVELMVVVAIIAAIIAIILPTLTKSKDTWEATECQVNLKEIYNSLFAYRQDRGHFPNESGIRFFLAPWHKKTVENDEKYAKIYVCPGDESLKQRIEGDTALIKEHLEDWDHVSSDFTSYSGRNQADHRINFKSLASELVVSDDDEDDMNHLNRINVLYLDGNLDYVLTEELGEEPFAVGDDAPIELFRVLSND